MAVSIQKLGFDWQQLVWISNTDWYDGPDHEANHFENSKLWLMPRRIGAASGCQISCAKQEFLRKSWSKANRGPQKYIRRISNFITKQKIRRCFSEFSDIVREVLKHIFGANLVGFPSPYKKKIWLDQKGQLRRRTVESCCYYQVKGITTVDVPVLVYIPCLFIQAV
jgi:hypothetical protein